VTVYAYDPNDCIYRDWQFFTMYPGDYCSCGVYNPGVSYDVYYTSAGCSGDSYSTSAPGPSGTIWIDFGQSGGPGYGTYSGWVDMGDGRQVGFSGSDVWHPVRVDYNGYANPVITSMYIDTLTGSTSTTTVTTTTSIPYYSYYEDDSYCDSVSPWICTTYWAYCYPVQSCWDNSYQGFCANYYDYNAC
jgi:hypothetical protein